METSTNAAMAVPLHDLVRLLPALDMTWPEDRQDQWWKWMAFLLRAAEIQSRPMIQISPGLVQSREGQLAGTMITPSGFAMEFSEPNETSPDAGANE